MLDFIKLADRREEWRKRYLAGVDCRTPPSHPAGAFKNPPYKRQGHPSNPQRLCTTPWKRVAGPELIPPVAYW